jgi:hypothetical protein
MHGDVVRAAQWLCLGMVLSALVLAAGLVLAVHGDRLLPNCCGGADKAYVPPAPAPSY